MWRSEIEGSRLAVVELGAGLAVPTVRYECESAGGQLIRVNPRDTGATPGSIVIPAGALQALREIGRILDGNTDRT